MLALYVIITRLCTLFNTYFERYCNMYTIPYCTLFNDSFERIPPLGFELATFESGTQRFVYRAKATFDIYRIHIVVSVIFIWWSPFIPSSNLDEVFTYNHIWL